MRENDSSVWFLYGTMTGRAVLKLIQKTHADRIVVRFLRSPRSQRLIGRYARRHGIDMSSEELSGFRTFRDFFAREREPKAIDPEPGHLTSPCDGWLSVYPIGENSGFLIKGSIYRIGDLLEDESLARNYRGGTCLVYRLAASDYHHYSYIDDGYQGKNHYIEGKLHSVQPIACETYPVFTLNRRSWCLMETENFGPVVQTEIGALIVGGIVNDREETRVARGSEKGHFELAGSTIVQLFEAERISLRPELAEQTAEGGEYRVEQGMWIADRFGDGQPS